MQLPPELLSLAVAVITSITSSAVTYGAMKARIDRLEKDMDRMGSEFITADVFRAHVSRIEQDLTDLKIDVREILTHFMSQAKANQKTT